MPPFLSIRETALFDLPGDHEDGKADCGKRQPFVVSDGLDDRIKQARDLLHHRRETLECFKAWRAPEFLQELCTGSGRNRSAADPGQPVS